jgi:hypothetical protein
VSPEAMDEMREQIFSHLYRSVFVCKRKRSGEIWGHVRAWYQQAEAKIIAWGGVVAESTRIL